MVSCDKEHLRQQRLDGWVVTDYRHMCEEASYRRTTRLLFGEHFDLVAAKFGHNITAGMCELERYRCLVEIQ